MERQKIFWVVLSVSVFVVVVLVVGVLLLRQRSSTEAPVTVSPLSGTETQIYEFQRPAAPGGISSGTQQGAAGTTAATPSAPGGVGGIQPATPSAPGGVGGIQPGTSQKPGDQQTMHFYIGEGEGQAPRAGTTPTPAASPSTVKPATQTPQATQSRTAARPTPAAAASKRPRKGIDFWIQTGSYKNQGKAEELVTLLGGKGLNGRVFSYTSKADTFYRVRIGPYTNKGDAEKFLAIVKQVQGLEASYIAQVTVTRSPVN
jgi:cell division septation protein DedD